MDTPETLNTPKQATKSLLRTKIFDLLLCVGGIYFCFMTMGLLQEKM